jgi:ABC-type Na+ efflux pump permease subunit
MRHFPEFLSTFRVIQIEAATLRRVRKGWESITIALFALTPALFLILLLTFLVFVALAFVAARAAYRRQSVSGRD